MEDLLETAWAVRSVNQNLGLTAIGSLEFYEPAMKFHEDAAELIAMYAFEPDYLRRFFAYVDNADNTAKLNDVGITAIPGHGDEIFTLVENAVLEGIDV